jgi:trigger factor
MNITRTDIDSTSISLTVKIEKPDYEESVAKALKDYRRKAQVPGFRPGNVPMGLVQKMYGASILAEKVNDVLDKAINDYLAANQIEVIGSAIPDEGASAIDFAAQSDFEFVYDFALKPKVEIDLNTITLPYYTIKVTDEDIEEELQRIRREFSVINELEEVAGNDFVLWVDVSQPNVEKNPIGIVNAILTTKTLPPDQVQLLQGKKKEVHFEVNIREMLTNDADCAAFLDIKSKELASIDPIVRLCIKRIAHFEPAEINQDLFDQVCGKDAVTTESAFLTYIESRIRAEYAQISNNIFARQATKILMEQVNVPLAEPILKRMVKLSSKDDAALTDEVLESNALFDSTRWQLITDSIAKQNNITLTDGDVMEYMRGMACQELMRYGFTPTEQQVSEYAARAMQEEKRRRQATDQAFDSKVFDALKMLAHIDNKEISRKELKMVLETMAQSDESSYLDKTNEFADADAIEQ